MKRIVMILMMMAAITRLSAQHKIDEERMERDIEVAENVLGTLIRQQLNKRNFFPFEVEGNYSPGYGVTFRLPMEINGPMVFGLTQSPRMSYNFNEDQSYSYSITTSDDDPHGDKDCEDCEKEKNKDRVNKTTANVDRVKAKSGTRKTNNDSLSTAVNQKMIAASKEFIADYGDMITQLTPDERIKVTNRNEGQRFWYAGANKPKRRFISLECTRGDITQFKQGKITRDQLLSKIIIVDSETSDEMSPDLELLSSIFNRLYRADLSKSYYVQENIYYERLKDYGVVYYMQVYSSVQTDLKKYDMATLNLENVDKETRDKKVKELYPVFEREVKESMLDYGRTLKSLKPNEVLVFMVRMTQCEGCGIPSSLELSVKDSTLNDFSSGKLTKDAAMAMITVKKGPNQ